MSSGLDPATAPNFIALQISAIDEALANL